MIMSGMFIAQKTEVNRVKQQYCWKKIVPMHFQFAKHTKNNTKKISKPNGLICTFFLHVRFKKPLGRVTWNFNSNIKAADYQQETIDRQLIYNSKVV